MGKPPLSKPSPGVYRDAPDRDDAASTSSALLMNDLDFPEADLPAYDDVVNLRADRREAADVPESQSYLFQPALPLSRLSRDETTVTTHWPDFSESSSALQEMLEEQAKYPPVFTARIIGTHSETVQRKDKKETTTVTDFDVRLDMTHLLVRGPHVPNYLQIHGWLQANAEERVYQGQRTKRMVSADREPGTDIAATVIEDYTTSRYPVRSFMLRRQMFNFDEAALEHLLSSLVGSTNYRGHTKISFPVTRNRVTVYSPCWQNKLRDKTWLRWIIYLTFLWIFTWPYLWFVTRRWEVLVAPFPYSCCPDCGNRRFIVKSEKAFFEEWRSSLRRAILGKKQGWIDEEYRLATEEALRQGHPTAGGRNPSTGNAVADGALGFLHAAVTARRDVAMAGGWGADS